MINEAAINAVKHGRNAVCQSDLFEAVEVVLVGKEKKDRIMSQEERRIVSYHEVGHALVSALQKDAEPVQKIISEAPGVLQSRWTERLWNKIIIHHIWATHTILLMMS